jgi:hypothetical protein
MLSNVDELANYLLERADDVLGKERSASLEVLR